MTPLISVMMTVYNLDGLVSRAISSILNQSGFSDFELLILDDGSTDKTYEVMLSFQDSRLRVFHEDENRGISYGRNLLMKKAKGEWFYFMDGDDFVSKNFLKEMSQRIEEHPDIDCFFVDIYNEDLGGNLQKSFSLEEGYLSSPYDFLENGLLCTQSQMVRRGLFEGIEWPIGRFYEDVGTIYRLLPRIQKAYTVGTSYYYHCYRQDSIVHSRGRKPDMDLVELTWEQWQFIRDKISLKAAKRQLGPFRMACLWVTLNYRRDEQTELAFWLYDRMKTFQEAYENLYQKI